MGLNENFKILTEFSPSWENIKTAEPDEWDLEMLGKIENDPECHEFTLAEEIDWGEGGE